MKKERLSKLQLYIMVSLELMINEDNVYRRKNGWEDTDQIHYNRLVKIVYEGYTNKPVRNVIGDKTPGFSNFLPSVSRSLLNMHRKGLIIRYKAIIIEKVEYINDTEKITERYDERGKVGFIQMTEKGREVLNGKKSLNIKKVNKKV